MPGFFCGFPQNLPRSPAIGRRIDGTPNPEPRKIGLDHPPQLLDAPTRGDGSGARSILHDHLCAAQADREFCGAGLTNRFPRLDPC